MCVYVGACFSVHVCICVYVRKTQHECVNVLVGEGNVSAIPLCTGDLIPVPDKQVISSLERGKEREREGGREGRKAQSPSFISTVQGNEA